MSKDKMTSRERVLRQIRGEEVDRPPLLGGWMNGADNLAALAGVSLDTYLANPVSNVVKANRALHVDCLLSATMVPKSADMIRTGHTVDADHAENEPEDLKRDGEAVPDSEREIIASLDASAIEGQLREQFDKCMPHLEDEVLIPTDFTSVPNFQGMFGQYGYASTFMAIALYPEAVGRLYWQSAVAVRFKNTILVKLIRELDLPPVVFTGHDICNNAGPMCSVDFLREYYSPQERYALEPFLESDIRVVRHCDGNIMPLVDDAIAAGYSGFQGFQFECGVDLRDLSARKSLQGERLLFLTGMNVTRTLPFGSCDDIRAEIDFVMDCTDGGKGLFFFTSSSIQPEAPLENVRCAHDYARAQTYGKRPQNAPRNWQEPTVPDYWSA